MLGDPFMIRFSADTSNVYLHKVNHWGAWRRTTPSKSFRRNVQDPITRTFKIKASRNDTLLIDVTSFFVSNDKLLTPIRQSPLVPGEMSATYDAAGSKLKGGQGLRKEPRNHQHPQLQLRAGRLHGDRAAVDSRTARGADGRSAGRTTAWVISARNITPTPRRRTSC